jgi:hypothetical protein
MEYHKIAKGNLNVDHHHFTLVCKQDKCKYIDYPN